MENTKQINKKPRTRTSVTLKIEREFIGDKTLIEAIIPVIVEDLRLKAERIHTLDNEVDSP